MRALHQQRGITLFAMTCSFIIQSSSQATSDSPLQIVMRVADKVVRETSFTVELVQQGEGKNPTLKAVIPEGASFRDHSYFEWHYSNGQMALAIIQLADATKDERYAKFIDQYCSTTLDQYDSCKYRYEVLNEKKVFNYRLFLKGMLDNTSAAALPFVERVLRGTLPAARFLVDEMADYVQRRQSRLSDSTLCRPDPEERTIWADDLFICVPFLLRYARLSGDKAYYDDATRQVVQFNHYLFDKKSGIAYHAWFDKRHQHSVAYWGRANGWMVWATSEALLHLPTTHADYKAVLDIYREQMKGLVHYQNQNGMWHQVLDHPESYEETSCTAMFTLALARGVLNEWIDKKYEDHVLRGWNAVKGRIAEDGTVAGICQGTSIGATLQYYFERKTPPHDPRGVGAVITAGIEVQRLLDQSKH
jgi:unsaturated rhamnogalacturonyl hydrolase